MASEPERKRCGSPTSSAPGQGRDFSDRRDAHQPFHAFGQFGMGEQLADQEDVARVVRDIKGLMPAEVA